MIRKFLLSLSILSAGVCLAAPLTPEEALSRLYDESPSGQKTRGALTVSPSLVLSTKIGEPALYVFNNQDAKGFMVVSADDAITPLLGYSDEGEATDDISPAMRDWLEQYAQQIEYARNNSLVAQMPEKGVTLPNWSPIQPLVKTQWNQTKPYNTYCPKSGNNLTPTGCVATAMSQVMKYWNYPEKGQGSITYTSSSLGINLSMNFGNTTFEWNQMLDSYTGNYTTAQGNAVAKLMQAAGYAVKMNYAPSASGAVSGVIPNALVQYFNYDKGITFKRREQYTYTDWAAMIYDNLSKIGPVIYDGQGEGGGHSFVCDGYNGNGYFHFNWGWGGSGDGYYVLDALNPSSLGTGGGTGGFNFIQDVIFGIQPPTGQPVEEQHQMVLYGSAQGVFEGNNVTFNLIDSSILGWGYQGIGSIVVDLGARIEPADNSSSANPYYLASNNTYNNRIQIDGLGYIPLENNGYSFRPTFRLNSLNLEPNVKYKITSVYRQSGHPEWYDVIPQVGLYNYFYITKTGSGNTAADFTIENMPTMQFNCDKLSFDSGLYKDLAVKTSIQITNKNNTELTRGVALVLFDVAGNIAFKGDNELMTLGPGETFTSSNVTQLYANWGGNVPSSGLTLYPGLYDEVTNVVYYKSDTPVTMMPNPGNPTYTITLTIDDASYSGNRYIVENSTDFTANVKIKVMKNIFTLPISVWIAEKVGYGYYPIITNPLNTVIIDQGETVTLQAKMSFPDAEIGEKYTLMVVTNGNIAEKGVEFEVLKNGAGVETIISEEEDINFYYERQNRVLHIKGETTSVDLYSINGMRLTPSIENYGDSAEVDLSSYGKGIIIVTATDKSGKRHSSKISL